MVAKEWERGETSKILAKEWGISVKRVEDCAIEASRFLRMSGDRDAILSASVAELLRITAESGNDRVPAIRLQLEAMGLLKQKHEVEVSSRVQSMSKLEVFATALKHPGFADWLVTQGWTPPKAAILTEGTET
jgi:hypothetical protein